MENWDNKILAEKLNSLQELPAGYTPDLSSKWEIISAGLPVEKKRPVSLLIRWSAVAAILLLMLATWIYFFTKTTSSLARQASVKSVTATFKSARPLLPETITATPVDQSAKTINKTVILPVTDKEKKQRIVPDSFTIQQSLLVINQEISRQKETTAPTITQPDTTKQTENSTGGLQPELAHISPVEKKKPGRPAVFQKDFNDSVLTTDNSFSQSGIQHFSVRIFLQDKRTEKNISVQRLQLAKTL